MKKWVNKVIFNTVMLVGVFFVFCINIYAFSGSGQGTQQNPYLISNVQQLNEVKNDLNASYKLIADIDLQNVEWIPIGGYNASFKGSFDGGNYTISNLRITSTDDYKGFFYSVDGGTIKNLTIENANVSGKSSIGGLAGKINNSEINNCSIKGNGSILGNGTKIGSSYNVGGLIGSVDGSTSLLIDCNADINVKGEITVGGLVGNNIGSIRRCYAAGNVSGASTIGGLIGSSANGNNGTIEISECYATGLVTSSTTVAGGFIGTVGSIANIKNCFALGDVQGGGSCSGFVGSVFSGAKISNCYSVGKVTGDSNVSGFSNSAGLTNCYFDGNAAQVASLIGSENSRLTTAMKLQANFINWDFNNTWVIIEGSSYPYLKNVDKPLKVSEGLPFDEMSGGKGTLLDPYLIKTLDHLKNVKYDLSSSYKLISDIDLQNIEWIPIGVYNGVNNAGFKGIFDGGNYTISNLQITSTGDNIGFFCNIEGGTIKNLTIENANVSGKSSIGGLAGRINNSEINNCSIKGNGSILGNGTKIGSSYYTGGLIGFEDGSTSLLIDCNASINIKGENTIGGLVGRSSGIIQRCYAVGNVSGSINVGGLIGDSSGGTTIEISECYTTSSVTSQGSAGGFIGTIGSTTNIKNCFALGNVQAGGSCGGFAYSVFSGAKISNCYSAGKVTGSSTISGLLYSGSIVNSYFDSTITGITTPATQARTTEQLMQSSTFIGWDMKSIWKINEGVTYPYLRNLPTPFEAVISAPESITYNNLTSTSVVIKWSEAPRATEYDIICMDHETFTTTELSKIFDNLTTNTEYKFKVRGKNENVIGLWSSILTIKTEPAPLVKVEGLSCIAKSATSITLNWKPCVDAESYEIQYDNIILTSNITSITINDLLPNTTYSFQVRAVNSKQKGDLSDPLNVKTNFYNPQTPYAKLFYDKCEEQLWFIDELEFLLNQHGKSINTLNSKEDFANIYAISLKEQNISGFIPKAIGEIYNLEYLYLSKNQLTGAIPNELYTLNKLKNLDLSFNELTGGISEQISNLKQLQVLLLHSNKLEGNIPTGICSLNKLENLDLAINNLSGQIPANIGSLDKLKFLSLSDNNLTGLLPESILTLSNLQVLILSNNSISGNAQSIISLFINSPKLRLIDLSNSTFTGGVSDTLLNYSENNETDGVIVVIN